MTSRYRLITIVVASALVWSCNSSGSVDDRLKRGDQYRSEGKLQEALIEYQRAVQADGRSVAARRRLGNAYIDAGDYTLAYEHLVRAADLAESDIPAQLEAGNFLLKAGKFEEARSRAEKALTVDPKNVDAHILKGNALAGMREFKSALTELQTALDTDPTNATGYSHLGNLQLAQGDAATAEASFRRAIAANPNSTTARLALANLFWSTNRRDQAEAAVKEALQIEPQGVLPNKSLALLYLVTGRAKDAEAPLKIVAAGSGDEGKIMLADYYANTSRWPEAKKLYEQVPSTSVASPKARLRLAALGLLTGDKGEAYRLIEGILAKDSNHVQALVALAQLQFSDGKATEAIATARKAVAADPNAALAHFVLGQLLRDQYQFEDAQVEFRAAVRVAPSFAPASVELGRLALQAGRPDEAAKYAEAAARLVPGYGDAFILWARAQVAAGKPEAALKAINAMASAFPDTPRVQAEVGRARLARQDYAGAEEAYRRALAKEPETLVALEGMVAVEVRKDSAAARKRLDSAVATYPRNSELQLMAGRMYATAFKDPAAARAAAQRAIDVDASNLAAYELLAQLFVQAGDLGAATREFEGLAAKRPKSVGFQTTVGMLYQLQNKTDQAKTAYEKALAIDPGAPIPANNLAQLLSDRNENLDIALHFAKVAKAAMPRAHEVDDTLGWLYYKKGMGGEAVTSLKAAVAAQPDNATYLYHLGAAYALKKDRSNARQTLEKALKKGTFDGADDARRMLESLNKG